MSHETACSAETAMSRTEFPQLHLSLCRATLYLQMPRPSEDATDMM